MVSENTERKKILLICSAGVLVKDSSFPATQSLSADLLLTDLSVKRLRRKSSNGKRESIPESLSKLFLKSLYLIFEQQEKDRKKIS